MKQTLRRGDRNEIEAFGPIFTDHMTLRTKFADRALGLNQLFDAWQMSGQ